MKKSTNNCRWKNIIIIDDEKKQLMKFELDKDERLVNLVSRPKKRKSLYKDIKITKQENNEKKPFLVFQHQNIFSFVGTDKADKSIETTQHELNKQSNYQNDDSYILKSENDNEKQVGTEFFDHLFDNSDSDSNNFMISSDIEM